MNLDVVEGTSIVESYRTAATGPEGHYVYDQALQSDLYRRLSKLQRIPPFHKESLHFSKLNSVSHVRDEVKFHTNLNGPVPMDEQVPRGLVLALSGSTIASDGWHSDMNKQERPMIQIKQIWDRVFEGVNVSAGSFNVQVQGEPGVIALVNDAFASHKIKFGLTRGAHLEVLIFLLCYGIKSYCHDPAVTPFHPI